MNLLEFLGLVGSLVGIMYWFVGRLEKDMQKMSEETNRKIDAFERRMDGHAARIDQLYQMFVDLVKK